MDSETDYSLDYIVSIDTLMRGLRNDFESNSSTSISTTRSEESIPTDTSDDYHIEVTYRPPEDKTDNKNHRQNKPEKRKHASTSTTDLRKKLKKDDDCTTCPICLDSWTDYGEHRLCTLRCGHKFGYGCLVRWLNTFALQRRCPICKRRVRHKDIH